MKQNKTGNKPHTLYSGYGVVGCSKSTKLQLLYYYYYSFYNKKDWFSDFNAEIS